MEPHVYRRCDEKSHMYTEKGDERRATHIQRGWEGEITHMSPRGVKKS
jgi:hypothetical protein